MKQFTPPYTTTYTGRHVSAENGEYPSLLDIAIGLARITRFAGQGQEFYSVLSHSLFMDDRYQSETPEPENEVRLAILLHDASECLTSDIPSPNKVLEQKKVQHALDRPIFDAYFHRYGGYERFCDREASPYKVVKALDWRALLSEYWSVGPGHPCYLDKPSAEDEEFFRKWHHNHLYIDGEKFSRNIDPMGRYGVRKYINRVIRLL